MDYTVRRLLPGDFEKGFFETLVNLTDVGLTAEQAKNVLHKMQAQDNHVFVAVNAHGEIVGTTTLLIEQKFIHKACLIGHIEDVAARKGHEGKGIGRAVMNAAIEYSKERGCYRIILDCSEHNTGFYEKLGFHRHGVEMRFEIANQR